MWVGRLLVVVGDEIDFSREPFCICLSVSVRAQLSDACCNFTIRRCIDSDYVIFANDTYTLLQTISSKK